MDISFHKMHGLGNDFVLLDMRAQMVELTPDQLRHLSDRRLGVGCDQILILEPPDVAGAAATYRIFNHDGSPAEHCGNGIRCVAHYLRVHSPELGPSMTVAIAGRSVELLCEAGGNVRVDMGPPILDPGAVPSTYCEQSDRYELTLDGTSYEIGVVSMGNPHAVFLTDDVETAMVEEIGSALQHHERFPNRVNVGFMQIVDDRSINLRVYERGAGETSACGTGACAAMVVGRLWNYLADTVKVRLRGGELTVAWNGQPGGSVWMTGPATYVFEGKISL